MDRQPRPAMSRRDRILAAAIQVFGSHGYAGTSTRAIAVMAELKHSLLFYHFNSKVDLYLAAFQVQITELAEALDASITNERDTYTQLKSFVEVYLSYFTEREPGLTVILREVDGLPSEVAAAVRETYRLSIWLRLERVLTDGVEAHAFVPLNNVSACAVSILAILNTFIRTNVVSNNRFTEDDILEQVLHYYTAGLIPSTPTIVTAAAQHPPIELQRSPALSP